MASASRRRQLVFWLCILVALGLNELLGPRISQNFYDVALVVLLIVASIAILSTLISRLITQRRANKDQHQIDRAKIIEQVLGRFSRK
jgi:uncharacterized membrane protein (DUF106 family)